MPDMILTLRFLPFCKYFSRKVFAEALTCINTFAKYGFIMKLLNFGFPTIRLIPFKLLLNETVLCCFPALYDALFSQGEFNTLNKREFKTKEIARCDEQIIVYFNTIRLHLS